jgi:PAS domain S-box-containing protein
MKAIFLQRRIYIPVLIIALGVFALVYGFGSNLFKDLQPQSIVGLVAVFTVLVAGLLYSFLATHTELQKRISELSTLGHVSQVLRASLDLDDLLPVIQEQVMQVIGVNNFYVALLDASQNQIWYPLAVKHGERQYWPARPVTDRLTDRVIRDAKTIMFTPQIQKGPNPVGIPKGEEMPKSWLGVPLITPQGCSGCLAVFQVADGIEFSQFDLDLLTTISSPVSITIENALLYKQTQFRASQLETLNRLSGQITASLELDQVVAQVTSAIAQVSGDQRSAIYLCKPGEVMVKLAHVHGLSDEFVERNKEFSIASGYRTRCLRSGKTELTSNLEETSLSLKFLDSIQVDEIQAMADFPLITPEGQVGFLSVFYAEPHKFKPDEIEILQTFAAQAALAVANAQLHATADEKLTRRVHQLAILESVGRELSAATHSEQLFKIILDYAIEFTQAPYGVIVQFDPETKLAIFKAVRGYDIPNSLSIEKGITIRAIKSAHAENVGDVRNDPDYLDIASGNALSQLSVPIIRESNVLGTITLESDQLGAFTENEQALVEQLANQAAVALANADFYHATQRHLRQQSTLYQVTARFAGSLDVRSAIDNLYQALIASTMPDHMGIYLWDESRRAYILQSSGANNESGYLPEYLVETRSDGTPFTDIPPEDVQEDTIREVFLALQEKMVVTAVYPMRTAFRIIGFVVICGGTEVEIAPDTQWICEAIIAQGTIAIQNAQLFTETTHRREQLAAVINSVAEAILMIDLHGRISVSNQPAITLSGLTRAKLLGSMLSDLAPKVLKRLGFSEQDLDDFLHQIADMIIPTHPKEIYIVEDKHIDSNLERTMERVAYPVMGTDDNTPGWMIVWRDVTEEQTINQEREAIADALIHDLRSPMTAVLGSLDLIDDVIPPEQHNEIIDRSLNVARRGARRVMRLIVSLLDVARMQSGRIELNKRLVDLTELLPELLAHIEVISDEFNIDVHSTIPPDLPMISIDEDKISRVITNLLDNAVKFSAEHTQVQVSASVEDDQILFQVRDHGPGVSEENRAIIFERFSQIAGQFGRWRGAGLGLAFCRLAVEAHGGRIWVESPPEGQGSIFGFRLPL